jgi:hypothetical protein
MCGGFAGVFQQSDLGRRHLAPFIQPVASAVLSVDWQGDILDQPHRRNALCAGAGAGGREQSPAA